MMITNTKVRMNFVSREYLVTETEVLSNSLTHIFVYRIIYLRIRDYNLGGFCGVSFEETGDFWGFLGLRRL